jgi:hypothetical protein
MKKAEQETIVEPHCFLFKVKPAALARQETDAGKKVALVFALFASRDEARKQAIKLLTANHWHILGVKIVSPLLPFQILQLDTLQKDCYKKATSERIAYCILENWPIFLRPEQYK